MGHENRRQCFAKNKQTAISDLLSAAGSYDGISMSLSERMIVVTFLLDMAL